MWQHFFSNPKISAKIRFGNVLFDFGSDQEPASISTLNKKFEIDERIFASHFIRNDGNLNWSQQSALLGIDDVSYFRNVAKIIKAKPLKEKPNHSKKNGKQTCTYEEVQNACKHMQVILHLNVDLTKKI